MRTWFNVAAKAPLFSILFWWRILLVDGNSGTDMAQLGCLGCVQWGFEEVGMCDEQWRGDRLGRNFGEIQFNWFKEVSIEYRLLSFKGFGQFLWSLHWVDLNAVPRLDASETWLRNGSVRLIAVMWFGGNFKGIGFNRIAGPDCKKWRYWCGFVGVPEIPKDSYRYGVPHSVWFEIVRHQPVASTRSSYIVDWRIWFLKN